MRIDQKDKDRKNKNKKKSTLETEIFKIMQNSMKAALDAALDDVLKEWK
jgi:hypothetical protein